MENKRMKFSGSFKARVVWLAKMSSGQRNVKDRCGLNASTGRGEADFISQCGFRL